MRKHISKTYTPPSIAPTGQDKAKKLAATVPQPGEGTLVRLRTKTSSDSLPGGNFQTPKRKVVTPPSTKSSSSFLDSSSLL